MSEVRLPCLHFPILEIAHDGGKILRLMGRLNESLILTLGVNHNNRPGVVHRVGAWFFIWDFPKGNVHLLGKVNDRFMRAGHPLKIWVERCKIPTKLIWSVTFWVNRNQMHCLLYTSDAADE